MQTFFTDEILSPLVKKKWRRAGLANNRKNFEKSLVCHKCSEIFGTALDDQCVHLSKIFTLENTPTVDFDHSFLYSVSSSTLIELIPYTLNAHCMLEEETFGSQPSCSVDCCSKPSCNHSQKTFSSIFSHSTTVSHSLRFCEHAKRSNNFSTAT